MNFQTGQRYLVQYRLDGQRKDRCFVGTFLDNDTSQGAFVFNLRPSAGTSSIPFDSVRSSQEVDRSVPHMQPAECEKWLAKNLQLSSTHNN